MSKLKIGNVELNSNIILGPMAGLTDRPFRFVCEKFEPGLVVTEMVSAKAIFYNDENTKKLMVTKDEKHPIAIQIFGSDEESMACAAKYVCENTDADIIDINMGCPAPKVVKNGDGSKLLLDLDKVYSITKAVVDNSTLPVTVKIRKGWDNDHIVAVEAAKQIEKAGAAAITIHGRTRSEFYTGTADWDIIKQVKESVSIPVIGNGDVTCPQDAEKMLKETGCDGVMISRATLGNPWIFSQTKEFLETGNYSEPTNKEKLETIIEHINLEIDEKGEYTGVREMRKHVCYYLKGMPNASEIRNEINHLESKEEVIERLTEFFSDK